MSRPLPAPPLCAVSRRWSLLALPLLLVAACAGSPPAPDAQATLARAEAAMGAGALHTLRFAGRGTGGTFGQAFVPGQAWPALNYSSLARVLDYDNAALREDFARSRGEPEGGGATPPMGQGEARVTGFARDAFAWNGSGDAAAAAPAVLDGRVNDLWTSPHGVLKAARRWGATAGRTSEEGRDYATLSVTVPGRLQATAWIDAAGLVARVDSTMPSPVLGDTPATVRYDDYRDAGGGVRFPYRHRQSQGGYPVLDLTVTEVQPNAPAGIEVPPQVRGFAENVTAQAVAPGVWFLAGGSHNSVAIETASQIVLVESPLYDGRAQAVIAKANTLVPGKAVRTVINSHHHFDHAGGLRAAVAEGATLVTSAAAKPWFERVFANANRIAPDRLAASGAKPKIVAVEGGRLVLNDGPRRIEVHELQGSPHAQGFLMVVLPAERLLIEADAWTPGPPNAAPPAVVNPLHRNLVDNLERLAAQGLTVDRVLPLHSRIATVKELYAQIGR